MNILSSSGSLQPWAVFRLLKETSPSVSARCNHPLFADSCLFCIPLHSIRHLGFGLSTFLLPSGSHRKSRFTGFRCSILITRSANISRPILILMIMGKSCSRLYLFISYFSLEPFLLQWLIYLSQYFTLIVSREVSVHLCLRCTQQHQDNQCLV